MPSREVSMRGLIALSIALLPQAVLARERTEDPDAKAARVEALMTDAERIGLLSGIMPIPLPGVAVEIPAGVPFTAGYVPPIARLGVPHQLATDASLGIANPGQMRPGDVATAMPSGLSLASSFDPAMAERVGATIGAEARAKGFNILLGGGMNLTRDPRNGRNFEYLGEDPLLAGTIAGFSIRGIQSQGVVSTIKHYALNAQETLRNTANAAIAESALRESDLLSFKIGIELGKPGAVMCAYNLVNGQKACGNDFLLNKVLKHDWKFPGWVMSDWGAVGDTAFINAGLDQQMGRQLDEKPWFAAPLAAAVTNGTVSRKRVSDAARRILRSLFAVGVPAEPYPPQPIDYNANAQVALEAARAGIVLLKNESVLPLAATAKSILVVGGNAEFGVLSGGGSSQVTPSNGEMRIIKGGEGPVELFNRQSYFPDAPITALRAALPGTSITYQTGYAPEVAAAYAAKAELVIVFATKWEGETYDSGSLSLPQGQDELIAKLAAANPNLIVVLETGNPVAMPWLEQAKAVVQAWYPGQEGGKAIADVLTGKVNPSGHLPMTYPAALEQYPRVALPGLGLPDKTAVKIEYSEGADVGYRAYARSGSKPLFPLGHGLSYTTFGISSLSVTKSNPLALSFTVTNTGDRQGASVPQLYLIGRNGEKLQRLVGFTKLPLDPGEKHSFTITPDQRLLADWKHNRWSLGAGDYTFAVGESAESLSASVRVRLAARSWQD
jgi:beta-glucosidase